MLSRNDIHELWVQQIGEKLIRTEFIIAAEKSEGILDKLEKQFSDEVRFRIIISSVEATIPKPANESEKPTVQEVPLQKNHRILRISRAELLEDVFEYSELNRNFVILVILSAVVGGIGILKDNIAIIIGAMVIAPFLGPNVSLAFGTVLGDIDLVRKSIRTGLAALFLALAISFLWGLLYTGDMREISRTEIKLSDIVVALASGIAGTIAILRGTSAIIVGVMVAVALLPPLLKTGLLAGEGYWEYSFYALLIFTANTICVNIAGIVTFFLAGIRPKYWWEEQKARKYTFRAAGIWFTLLIILTAIVIYLNL